MYAAYPGGGATQELSRCGALMAINPQLAIEPVGCYGTSRLDDFHRFKFVAETGDSAELFDAKSIDSSEFVKDFRDWGMDRGWYSSWWKLPKQGLSGGGFYPVKRRGGNWRQDIWFRANGDGTLTVNTVMERG